jgi:hypothetical protein
MSVDFALDYPFRAPQVCLAPLTFDTSSDDRSNSRQRCITPISILMDRESSFYQIAVGGGVRLPLLRQPKWQVKDERKLRRDKW